MLLWIDTSLIYSPDSNPTSHFSHHNLSVGAFKTCFIYALIIHLNNKFIKLISSIADKQYRYASAVPLLHGSSRASSVLSLLTCFAL